MDNETELRLNLLSDKIINSNEEFPRIVLANVQNGTITNVDDSVTIPLGTMDTGSSASTTSIESEPLKSGKNSIELVWRDLTYSVPEKRDSFFSNPFATRKQNHLVKNLNGSIQSGQLTAIIGPSGAGKTTLIECLAGRRISGVTGDIVVKYNSIQKKSIKISYYSQKDSLSGLLTVEESLMYASQLRNCIASNRDQNFLLSRTDINANKPQSSALSDAFNTSTSSASNSYHMKIIDKLIADLNLVKCRNTRVDKCSGGQCRRLSIALELIFSPSIFLLDEPTSGLDSLSSLQCIQLLKKLTTNSERPMIVATSIHQPTAKIMSYFDHLFILSSNGQCIYNGPSQDLVAKLSSFGLNCPQYHNPADYVVEVATGDFGQEPIEHLAANFRSICEQQGQQIIEMDSSIKIKKLVQSTQEHSLANQLLTTAILTRRCFVQSIRDPKIYIARSIILLLTLGLIKILYHENKIGLLDGCVQLPTRYLLEQFQNFELIDTHNAYFANFGFLFYSVILMVFIAILPTLLSFPLEVSVFVKENFNGWYSLRSYYMARSLADLPPILIFPIVYGYGSYHLTSQIDEFFRFTLYNYMLVLVSFLAQGLGFLVSASFVNDVTSATVVGAIINVPLFLFTGLLIKISSMPAFFQPFTYISYFRLAFESLLVIIYGMGRCLEVPPLDYKYLKGEFGEEILDMYTCITEFNSEAAENITNLVDNYNTKFLHNMNQTSNSFALNAFQYDDSILYTNICIMIFYILLLRLLAYFVLKHKISVR